MVTSKGPVWPHLPYDDWAGTCSALHLWTQIIGKYRLSLTPWVNHSWHATLYVTPRGLTSGPVPDLNGFVSVSLDFCDHVCIVDAEAGRRTMFALEPMSVAAFHDRLRNAVEQVGGHFDIHGSPNEVENPVAFVADAVERDYDSQAVRRFHQALFRIERVFTQFRTAFVGKVSPVHLFWGSFDLAITRFSGRTAPRHPGGIPHLPDTVTREAYSHEVSSAGFWPGMGYGEPMFYSYGYPTPTGFAERSVKPDAAFWHEDLGEFLLPYEAVRSSENPERTLLDFLESTYAAAADTANWNRSALECEVGQPRIPRAV